MLSNRRVHRQRAEKQVDLRRRDPPVFIPDFDLMVAANGLTFHLLGDRRVALAAQPVHARADQKMGLGLLVGTEELEDVALAISDLNAP
jgi:hypothetical protein